MIRKFTKKSMAVMATLSMLAVCTAPTLTLASGTDLATMPTFVPSATESINSNKGQAGSGEDLKNLAASQAQSFVSNKVSEYLSQFGTVELSVSDLSNSSKVTGSLDMLLPIVERKDDLFYTQLGVRKSSQYTESWRTTINAGLGYRKFFDAKYDYMLGANFFYDQDLTVGHQRMGVGGEFWLDNLKLAANAYMPLSNWKKSPDLDRYFERPAKGFDVRAEGYLPMYPQLGGKLMYEQHFGNKVGLFGVKDENSNPKALTVGLSYTPVPAISFEVDHKMGTAGRTQTSGKLNFKYQLGVPWSKQFSSSEVAASRKLDAMRYDLVHRNNEIALEYKKDTSKKDTNPSTESLLDTTNLRIEEWDFLACSYSYIYMRARVFDKDTDENVSGINVTLNLVTRNQILNATTDASGFAEFTFPRSDTLPIEESYILKIIGNDDPADADAFTHYFAMAC